MESGRCRGIEEGMEILLGMLDNLGLKATFFVSAELLPRYAEKIASLASAGHEVASHGYRHNIDYATLSAEELFDQVERSKKMLEDCTQTQVFGFRTPQFRQNALLPRVLARAGYGYDSSLTRSSLPGRYRNSGAPLEPFMREEILEIPIARMPVLPVAFGLLWTNALGVSCYRFISRFDKEIGGMRVFYLHPFDLVRKSWNPRMKLHVNLFYLWRSKTVVKTFDKLFAFWRKNQVEFPLLRDVFQDYRQVPVSRQ